MKFLILACTLLCSCTLLNKKPEVNTNIIYQPRVLILEKGTNVQTKEGLYKAQEKEIWHSHKTYTELENKYIYLLSEQL